MPLVWGIGLVYFGLNDNVWGIIGWCFLFISLIGIQQWWMNNREFVMVIYNTIRSIIEHYLDPQKDIVCDDVLILTTLIVGSRS